MTQTNNEREEYEKYEIWLCTLNSFSPAEMNFGFLAWKARAQSPISKNEQQEAVAYAWEYESPDKTWKSITSNKTELQDHLEIGCALVRELFTSPTKQAIPEGWKLVKIEPSNEHLRSMAIRSDHGLGVDGYYDTKPIQFGASHAQRMESSIREMRQLYEEAIGEGFYKLPEAPTNTEVGE